MKPGFDGKLNPLKWPEDSFIIEDITDTPVKLERVKEIKTKNCIRRLKATKEDKQKYK